MRRIAGKNIKGGEGGIKSHSRIYTPGQMVMILRETDSKKIHGYTEHKNVANFRANFHRLPLALAPRVATCVNSVKRPNAENASTAET